MPINEKLWGVQGTYTPKPKVNYDRIDTTGWPTESRACRVCGEITTPAIHPDAHAEWLKYKDEPSAETHMGVKLTRMALSGATCDRCGISREMFIEAREGVSAIAVELLRAQGADGSNLSEDQERKLLANLRTRLKRYSEALRRMNNYLDLIWDDKFVTLIWDKPQSAWRFMKAMSKFLYQQKPVKDQMNDMINWLQRMKQNA